MIDNTEIRNQTERLTKNSNPRSRYPKNQVILDAKIDKYTTSMKASI
ncbi:MAG: hypothetical protein ICV56_01145 [Nitrososphaeraceae archaeon]|nr:hypothetical protein [Nitrososphaeraceae archaeon]